MGTNFYWILKDGATPLGDDLSDSVDDMDPRYHIGKRSAAGLYCYDCGVLLVEGGDRNAHSETAQRYDACPKCGKTRDEKHYNAAMVELGFAEAAKSKLTGVHGAASFSYAQEPDAVERVCNEHLGEPVIEDEYGQEYTGQEFLWMLDAGCPVRGRHSIGVYFC